jgi:putative transposase
VWTLTGRIKGIPFHGEPKLTDYLANWKLGDARLFVRKGDVFLSVSFNLSLDYLNFDK